MILSEIIEEKRRSIQESKELLSLEDIKREASLKKIQRRNFKHAISNQHDVNIIAEIKRASPTRGLIRKDFNPAHIAEEYQINGACAISVLTEQKYFQGKLEYIKMVKEVSSLPVLRKDFIVDEYQVYESALAGSDAILLIADILTKENIREFSHLAKSFNMSILCEVHNEEDLEKAISAKADIIGINNRDLHTFKLSIDTTQNLMGLVPKGKIVVSESGIRSRSDILFLKSLGINAVLIGEVFMDAEDIGAKVKEFIGR
ncbi:MAG: indole-3-glycerol phosphate synthase TrpC [Candidatus Omnitrophota bacterium]